MSDVPCGFYMAAQKGYGMKRSWFLIVLCLPLLLCGCAQKSAEREFFAMDTVMQLRAYGPAAEDALAQAEAEIYRLEGVLSCRDEQAALARLNETGGGTAGEETAALLQTALTLCEQTGGAYDPALGALSEAWGFSTGAYRVPEPDALAEAMQSSGAGLVQLDGISVTLTNGGMRMTIPKTVTAVLSCRKPDDTYTQTIGTVLEDGGAAFTLSGNTLSVPGTVRAEVQIRDGDKLLTSAEFEIRVPPQVVGDDLIESSDQSDVLGRLIEETGAAIADLNRRVESGEFKGEKGDKGDVQFATFEINPFSGNLLMHTTPDVTVQFRIKNQYLELTI